LAGRLDRVERLLDDDARRALASAAGGTPLRVIVAGLLDALDPDRDEARARQIHGLGDDATPDDRQLRDAQQELRDAAAAPLAHNPELCQALLDVRRRQEQTIDDTSLDEVLHSGAAPQRAPAYDRELVDSFRAFIAEHRDEIDALQVLYSRPHGRRLTRAQIRELADAVEHPPRRWTTERLWAAYETVERDRVRGAGAGRLWTDIVSLARHALRPEDDLVPFADQVHARFAAWLAQQQQRGRAFSEEQLRWLTLIRDRIAADAEVRTDDLDDVPFAAEGGLGRFHALFGEQYERIVEELNAELVA
jgi:type I restriction enzyme R subunit